MADFAAFRRADKARLTDAIRREVVVQHERLFALTLDRVDDLRIAAGAERGGHNRLRLTAGEKCRTVSTRQNAHLYIDRAHGTLITAVDARLAADHPLANDGLLKLRQRALDLFGRPARVIATRQRLGCGRLGLANGGLAILLVRNAVGVRQCAFGRSGDSRREVVIGRRRLPVPGRLADFGSEFINSVDGDLQLLVTEHDGTQHHFF